MTKVMLSVVMVGAVMASGGSVVGMQDAHAQGSAMVGSLRGVVRDKPTGEPVGGATIATANARTLAETDVHAHNTFDRPREVEPRDEQTRVIGGRLIHRFAPASVTRLQITLA